MLKPEEEEPNKGVGEEPKRDLDSEEDPEEEPEEEELEEEGTAREPALESLAPTSPSDDWRKRSRIC